MTELQVRMGKVIGRDHLARRANCQDAGGYTQVGDTWVGVVCDGCGSGPQSEIGANLAAQYLIEDASRLLKLENDLQQMLGLLHNHLIDYLTVVATVSQPSNFAEYVQRNLLFTVVGFIVSPDGGIVFAAGDGLVTIDDEVLALDQSNQPDYPAYHLIPNALPSDYQLPTVFQTWRVEPDWQRLAVGTDGFEVKLLPDVWEQRHPRGLQRKMNVWSDRHHCFRDDATIITAECSVQEEGM